MKKTLILAAVSASLALTGCGSAGSGGNTGNAPTIENTNPVITASVNAPAGVLPMKYLSSDGGYLDLATYRTYDPTLSDDDLKAKNFILDGSDIRSHFAPGQFMTASGFDPVNGVLLSDLLGISPEQSTGGYTVDLNALGTAITTRVLMVLFKDAEDGVEDEVGHISLSGTLDEAAMLALQLDGYSRTDAENATDSVKLGALEADLAEKGTADDLQRLFNAQLNGSTWTASNGSALIFAGNVIGYESAGTNDEATYTVALNSGTYELSTTFDSFGAQTIDLTTLVGGGDEMTLMGQTYTRQ